MSSTTILATQQPTTNNQQPTTNNQQPTTNNPIATQQGEGNITGPTLNIRQTKH